MDGVPTPSDQDEVSSVSLELLLDSGQLIRQRADCRCHGDETPATQALGLLEQHVGDPSTVGLEAGNGRSEMKGRSF